IQEDIGLDVLVHGEFERNDMVEFFGEKLQGFLVTKFGWVQSYASSVMRLFFQSARYFRTSRLCGNDPIVVVGKSGKFKRFCC
ncbi:hypothetical protein INO99_16600, partial [Staphylococcus aureus]|nr:hypothetical protein [Staphylococcus aureus]MBO8509565.1 hypothetical protein [Staphylococcus aureus]